MSQRQPDFNKENNELGALISINDVDERFIMKASKCWWAYQIAYAWNLNPLEVKKWHAEDILEALAAIGLAEKNKPK